MALVYTEHTLTHKNISYIHILLCRMSLSAACRCRIQSKSFSIGVDRLERNMHSWLWHEFRCSSVGTSRADSLVSPNYRGRLRELLHCFLSKAAIMEFSLAGILKFRGLPSFTFAVRVTQRRCSSSRNTLAPGRCWPEYQFTLPCVSTNSSVTRTEV